jgi:hypothetical protein
MKININHTYFYLNALRTALIFIFGLLTYEIIKEIEIEWNKIHPNNELYHLSKRKVYHFILIFFIDLIILYLIAILFKIQL